MLQKNKFRELNLKTDGLNILIKGGRLLSYCSLKILLLKEYTIMLNLLVVCF